MKFKKFDPTNMKSPNGGPIGGIFNINPVIAIIGNRMAGKTWLTKDLMNKMSSNIDDITIFKLSQCKEYNIKHNHTQKVINHKQIYKPELIKNMIERKQYEMHKEKNGTGYNIKNNLVVLDNITDDSSIFRNEYIKQLFMNGRHYKTSLIITVKYALNIPPSLRVNIDYIFIFKDNILANKQRYFDHYARIFPTFEMFCQVMDACTKNYECLVIDNTTISNKLEDMIYWYKAEEVDEIRIGYTDEEINAVKKIELWFLEHKYNPKYKYCRKKVIESYNDLYEEPMMA